MDYNCHWFRFYLFGKIKFHDDKNEKISTTRKFWVLSFGFIGYLVQGLIPAERPKLQMLSGILPPINEKSYFHDEKMEF